MERPRREVKGRACFHVFQLKRLSAIDQACLVEPESMPRVLRNQNKKRAADDQLSP